MQHDLFSSLDSLLSVPAGSGGLLIRDVTGQYRPAEADEVLLAAQRLLAAQVRGSDLMDSPAVVKDFLRSRQGHLPQEVFAVMHLNSQNRVLDYVEMFRGTVSQTSVYPREVVRNALLRNSSALVGVNCVEALRVSERTKADVDTFLRRGRNLCRVERGGLAAFRVFEAMVHLDQRNQVFLVA